MRRCRIRVDHCDAGNQYQRNAIDELFTRRLLGSAIPISLHPRARFRATFSADRPPNQSAISHLPAHLWSIAYWN
jgi:hypothetical protein